MVRSSRGLCAAFTGLWLVALGTASFAQAPAPSAPPSAPASAPAASPPSAPPSEPAPGATAPATEPASPAPAGPGAPGAAGPTLEAAREAVRATTVWLARGVDSWFGNRPFEAGGKVSDGMLSIGLFKREGERPDVDARLHARLSLPNLGESGFAFLGRDDPREVIADTPGAVARQERLRSQVRDEREFLAGIGVALRDAFDVRLGMRGGFKLYLQARYHDEWVRDDVRLIEFRQTFFLTKADQLGSTTALSVAYAVSPDLTVRWLGAATITQRTRRYELASVLGAYRSFERGRLLSLELSSNALEGTGVTVDDAGLVLKWSQPFLREWLVGEVAVGRFWPRPDPALPRARLWGGGVGVRLSF